MTSKKERRRSRRRAERFMEEAWEALLEDNPTKAERKSRQAIDLGQVNPRLWLEHAKVLARLGQGDEAEEAARHAIALAPTFAEAFVFTAECLATRGRHGKAVELLERAVELGADEQELTQLASWRALAPETVPRVAARASPRPAPEFTSRTRAQDWTAIAAELAATGVALLPALLSAEECAGLRALWDDEERFEHGAVLAGEAGRVEYRFLAQPLPELVRDLRSEVYARLVPIANSWNERLARTERFPPHLDTFLEQCRRAGQYRSTPILLRYETGGFNAPHRDVAGRVVFPLQLAVTLGPASTATGGGGELVLVDHRHGRRRHERAVGTATGDGVVFCTRERLVEVGGYPGLRPVSHGVREVHATRLALGVPFHEHG